MIFIHKPVGPDGIHQRIVGELVKLSLSYYQSWPPKEVSGYWRLENVMPIRKKCMRRHPGNNRLVSLISVSGKVMKQIIVLHAIMQ